MIANRAPIPEDTETIVQVAKFKIDTVCIAGTSAVHFDPTEQLYRRYHYSSADKIESITTGLIKYSTANEWYESAYFAGTMMDAYSFEEGFTYVHSFKVSTGCIEPNPD